MAIFYNNISIDSYELGPFQRNLVCDPAIISQEKDIRDKQVKFDEINAKYCSSGQIKSFQFLE